MPEDTAFAFVLDCTSNARDFGDSPFFPLTTVGMNGTIGVTVQAGEDLACAWYDVPAAGPGLTVQVYVCGSNQPSLDTCDPATGNFHFVLAPVADGDLISFPTDENGAAHVDGLDGTYTLSEVGRQPCAIESADADADGNLALSPERETVANVFHCG